MSRYQALLQERADLVKQNAALSPADRAPTAEEGAAVDANIERLNAIALEVSREEQRREHERTVQALPESNAVARFSGGDDRSGKAPWGILDPNTGAYKYRFGTMLQAVFNKAMGHGSDPRLVYQAAGQGMNESVGSQGGFMVGFDILPGILTKLYQTGEILARVNKVEISANSNSLVIRAINETSRATGSRLGGIQGYWVAEGGTKTASRPAFREMELKLKKLAALGYTTDELMQDASALDTIMTDGFADELRFLAEDAIVNGTGAGMPLGFFSGGNAPALVSIAKETSQIAATVVPQNIVKMYARLWARSRPNAVWLINQDVEPSLQLMTLGFRNVAGTENVGGWPVYLPAGGLSASPFATLLGLPVIPVEYCSTLGTQGDIFLVDLSQYIVITKGGVLTDSSMHVAFFTDEMCFRCVYRIDGQPVWNAPLTPFKGSNTLSPFVTLDTRS